MTEHRLTKSRKAYYFYGSIFVLSSVINLIQNHWLISPLNHLYADMQGYIERAMRMAEGAPREAFDLFYPPGTSYLYALFFRCFSKNIAFELIIIAQAISLAAANIIQSLCSVVNPSQSFSSQTKNLSSLIGGHLFLFLSVLSSESWHYRQNRAWQRPAMFN